MMQKFIEFFLKVCGLYYSFRYCPEHPMALPRSSKWPTVRNHHLLKEPRCAVCEGTDDLNVHHVKPVHLFPELELDPLNLITLCEARKCHFLFGHLLNWKSYNPSVRIDAADWRQKIKERKDS